MTEPECTKDCCDPLRSPFACPSPSLGWQSTCRRLTDARPICAERMLVILRMTRMAFSDFTVTGAQLCAIAQYLEIYSVDARDFCTVSNHTFRTARPLLFWHNLVTVLVVRCDEPLARSEHRDISTILQLRTGKRVFSQKFQQARLQQAHSSGHLQTLPQRAWSGPRAAEARRHVHRPTAGEPFAPHRLAGLFKQHQPRLQHSG